MTPLKIVMPNQFGEVSINTLINAPDAGGPIIFGGEGDPNGVYTAPENSLYVATDAATSDAWLWRNTDGEDTWEAMSSESSSDVRNTVLTGFVSGNGTVTAADTILTAFNKTYGKAVVAETLGNAALPSASFTAAAVTAKVLTGLAAGANTPITATDTVLVALANLQAQISAL